MNQRRRTVSVKAASKKFGRKVRNNRTLLFMCLPAVAFFIIFSYCPLPGVYIAFTN